MNEQFSKYFCRHRSVYVNVIKILLIFLFVEFNMYLSFYSWFTVIVTNLLISLRAVNSSPSQSRYGCEMRSHWFREVMIISLDCWALASSNKSTDNCVKWTSAMPERIHTKWYQDFLTPVGGSTRERHVKCWEKYLIKNIMWEVRNSDVMMVVARVVYRMRNFSFRVKLNYSTQQKGKHRQANVNLNFGPMEECSLSELPFVRAFRKKISNWYNSCFRIYIRTLIINLIMNNSSAGGRRWCACPTHFMVFKSKIIKFNAVIINQFGTHHSKQLLTNSPIRSHFTPSWPWPRPSSSTIE